MENSEELQLELRLADLLYPDFHKTYNENGGYWYMNDRRIDGPNFMGYVPKWTRDDAACFQLMSEHNCWPTQISGGITYGEKHVVCEMYHEHPSYEHETEIDFKRRIDRLAIVKAVLVKLTVKKVLLKTEKEKKGKKA